MKTLKLCMIGFGNVGQKVSALLLEKKALTAALVLSAAAGAVLLVTRRGSRRTRLPFLSFTAAAWVLLTAALQSGVQW